MAMFSAIHLSSWCLLCIFYVPGTVLGARDLEIKILFLNELNCTGKDKKQARKQIGKLRQSVIHTVLGLCGKS